MKLIRKVIAIFDGTVNLLAFMAAVLLVLMMLVTNYEVVMRYFLARPTVWTMDIVGISMLYMTFLGAAWVLKRGGHVTIDTVLNQLSPRTRSLVNVITSVISALICLVVTWYGSKVTWQHLQRNLYLITTVLPIPSALTMFVIPIGTFLLSINFLRKSYGYLRDWKALPRKENSPPQADRSFGLKP